MLWMGDGGTVNLLTRGKQRPLTPHGGPLPGNITCLKRELCKRERKTGRSVLLRRETARMTR